ncbi:MAG: ABC transporter permease subunit [Pseudomonadota bacterium]
MTAIDRPPKATFRIDMLWTDSRYRSSFIQVVALFLVLTLGYLLVQNVVANLAALGKEFGFSFMRTPASYDINQTLIDYTSRDSHARAAVIGIMNTLLVAVVGCLLATVIGVLAGVARLSKNWMLRTVVGVYVEGVRNIPVLIQILLFSALIVGTLPQPRDFRGDDAQASMILFDSVALTGRGFYFPMPIFNAGSAFVIGALIAGIIAAVVFGRWAKSRQQETGEVLPVLPIKAALIVFTPIVMFLITAIFVPGWPITLELPELQGFNFRGGIFARESYVALTLALAFYTGAFIAENVRAGIQSVSKGQTEASFALGLQPGRTMSLVILPQALRVIIPPLISQYLNLTKNSSLALLVGYMDVTGTLMGITLNQTGREFETLFLGMAVYLSISLSIAGVMNLYNENTKLVERTSATGMGLSVLSFFGGATGQWEQLKKGDAVMHNAYGIRGFLNLYVLFYVVWIALLINYVFVEGASEIRPSYWDWGFFKQFSALLMIALSGAALATCLFKNARFIDMVALEFLFFIFALLVGFPFAALTDSLSFVAIVAGGAAIRLAIFGYTMFGSQPNLTFFHRVRPGEA